MRETRHKYANHATQQDKAQQFNQEKHMQVKISPLITINNQVNAGTSSYDRAVNSI